jgi:formylmethanofuran dehydrogenase subunit C
MPIEKIGTPESVQNIAQSVVDTIKSKEENLIQMPGTDRRESIFLCIKEMVDKTESDEQEEAILEAAADRCYLLNGVVAGDMLTVLVNEFSGHDHPKDVAKISGQKVRHPLTMRISEDCARIHRLGGHLDDNTALTISGNVGDFAGEKMDDPGSVFTVIGNVGTALGSSMSRGRIEVQGNAGDGAAFHLSGGEIIIRGNAGKNIGMGMTGGKLSIGGDVGEFAPDVFSPENKGTIEVKGSDGSPVVIWSQGEIANVAEFKRYTEKINREAAAEDLRVLNG